jgi:hypothetical protein
VKGTEEHVHQPPFQATHGHLLGFALAELFREVGLPPFVAAPLREGHNMNGSVQLSISTSIEAMGLAITRRDGDRRGGRRPCAPTFRYEVEGRGGHCLSTCRRVMRRRRITI